MFRCLMKERPFIARYQLKSWEIHDFGYSPSAITMKFGNLKQAQSLSANPKN